MPVYTWTTQEGTFSEDQKKALAKSATDTHCNATGAPRSFVRILFNTYPKGSCFLGDTPSPAVLLVCQIRAGRSLETKQSIIRELNDATMKIGRISSDALTIILEEVPPTQAMEFGAILPEASPEQEKQWNKAHLR